MSSPDGGTTWVVGRTEASLVFTDVSCIGSDVEAFIKTESTRDVENAAVRCVGITLVTNGANVTDIVGSDDVRDVVSTVGTTNELSTATDFNTDDEVSSVRCVGITLVTNGANETDIVGSDDVTDVVSTVGTANELSTATDFNTDDELSSVRCVGITLVTNGANVTDIVGSDDVTDVVSTVGTANELSTATDFNTDDELSSVLCVGITLVTTGNDKSDFVGLYDIPGYSNQDTAAQMHNINKTLYWP